ncbi:hypothetical protein DCAR_0310777 [Daucus carota subsp. sativus]|uniref:Uncharacterized protein n=1 Tax=Daucus carota subsp. sativus TaxID=79200 RepID=A0A162AH15_DAUCS|nr:hypothetical protein DCAR_0310777 [Daucus carota subsp. sativus]
MEFNIKILSCTSKCSYTKIEDRYLDSFLMFCNNDVKWFETPNLQSLTPALDMRYNVYLDRTLI